MEADMDSEEGWLERIGSTNRNVQFQMNKEYALPSAIAPAYRVSQLHTSR
jgi:hypothetical protein